jgi:hypothetical protein
VGPYIKASVETAYALKSDAARFQYRWTGPRKAPDHKMIKGTIQATLPYDLGTFQIVG